MAFIFFSHLYIFTNGHHHLFFFIMNIFFRFDRPDSSLVFIGQDENTSMTLLQKLIFWLKHGDFYVIYDKSYVPL